MSADERVGVKTSVPRYQKEAWTEHADALDMSQSEFVRTMVQAGRRGFEPDPLETGSPDANPRGNGLSKPVLEALSSGEHREFDEIVESVTEQLDRSGRGGPRVVERRR
ncbi:MAG: DUF5805 domain-containing protein [Halobacteriales archaeon]|nr:DUF5805 domain-containing protein [Halobacteriales archaeon]